MKAEWSYVSIRLGEQFAVGTTARGGQIIIDGLLRMEELFVDSLVIKILVGIIIAYYYNFVRMKFCRTYFIFKC